MFNKILNRIIVAISSILLVVILVEAYQTMVGENEKIVGTLEITQPIILSPTEEPSADTGKYKFFVDTTHNKLCVKRPDGTMKMVESGTREFFIYPNHGDDSVGNWSAEKLRDTDETFFSFKVPEDFSSLETAKIILIPNASETIQFDLKVSVAAIGEEHDNDTRQALDETLAVTNKELTEIDISSQLTGLTADDFATINFESDTSDLYPMGLYLKFNL